MLVSNEFFIHQIFPILIDIKVNYVYNNFQIFHLAHIIIMIQTIIYQSTVVTLKEKKL